MDGDGSSSSGDVSLMATHDHEVPLSGPELPQPNAWPPMGPTENDVAFLRQFTTGVLISRLRAALGVPNTPWRSANAIFSETRDDGDGGDDDPRHSDVLDADADAGADDDDDDDDDAYGGFGFSFGAVLASGVAIACLPETTVGIGGEGKGEARERGQCAVCLEEYEAGDALRTMPCAHGFHERCIFGWLRASRLCPLCRFPLPAEEEDMAMATDVEVDVGREDQGEADDGGRGGAFDTFERMFPT